MSQLLAQKKMADGSTLQLKKYQLDQEGAEALRRPVGSDEMVLILKKGVIGARTKPRLSWYINEEGFRKLYDAVKNAKDFEGINQSLSSLF